jgi:Chromosome segregation ATPases
MADTTFGVKVPDDLKEQLTKLMQDSGLTGKDFMQSLVNVYQVEKTKEGIPEVAQDLKELQSLTQRINNIYLNLGYRIDNLMKSKETEMQEQLQRKDAVIATLQNKIEELDSKNELLTETFNTSVSEKDEAIKRVNELTNMYNDNKALVEEYKNKNDMLTGLLNEYKTAKEENENLKSRLDQSNLTNIQVNNDNIAKGKEIENLKESVETLSLNIKELKNQYSIEKQELKSLHKDEITKAIEDTIRAKESEKREALLKIKEQHQEKVESIHNEYATKINEYQEKYRDLLKELEYVKEISINTDNKQQ